MTEKRIKEIIGDTWFDVSVCEGEPTIESREYGDVGEETHGIEDWLEGVRIVKALRAEGVRCDVDTCDEFVMVNIY